jgi:hypothetical protein
VTTDPPELGKGLFGYRKSAVNQILADRDIMLRQAEGRVRAAESKVAELQGELTSIKDRNTRMDEQIERLRSQLEILAAKTGGPVEAGPSLDVADSALTGEDATSTEASEPAGWDTESAAWEDQWTEPAADVSAVEGERGVASYEEFGESVAAFEGLDQMDASVEPESHRDLPMVIEGENYGEGPDTSHLFDSAEQEEFGPDFGYQPPATETDRDLPPWVDAEPPAPEPTRKVDEMLYEPDQSMASASSGSGADDEGLSVPYGFSLQPEPAEASGEHVKLDEQPVFRGFTEELEEPVSSQPVAPQPAASEPAAQQAAPPEQTQAPQPEQPEQPAQRPEAPQPAPVDQWPPEAPHGAPEWAIPQAAVPPAPEWSPPPAPPAPEWPPQPAPPAQEWPPQPAATTAEPAHEPEAEGRAGVSQQASDITNRFLTEELKGVLAAAEESAARIVERARVTSEHQIAQSNRLWREVQAELARFSTWRDQVDPIIHSVHSKVEGVRSQIEEVPEKIRQALAPMADSISMIDADLAELSSASNPPLLLTPSELETGAERPVQPEPRPQPSSTPRERLQDDPFGFGRSAS